jgi:hypothetical protein
MRASASGHERPTLTNDRFGADPRVSAATSIHRLYSNGSRPKDPGAGQARSPAGPGSPRSFGSPDLRSERTGLQRPPAMSRRHPAAPRDKFSSAYRHLSSSPRWPDAPPQKARTGAHHTRHIGAVHEREKAIREPSRMAFQVNCRCSSSGSVHLLSVQRDNEDTRVSFHAGRATPSLLLI